MQLTARQRGFSLVELAVVMMIIALLLSASFMTWMSATDQRLNDETTRRINLAIEGIHAFAIINRRLPCPAIATTQAQESFCPAATGTCAGTETTVVQAHGNCSNFYNGFLPAASLGGTLPSDAAGFALDAWGNRLRYAVARDFNTVPQSCTTLPPANTRVWTSTANLKTYGVSCKTNDLEVCASSVGTTPTSCNTAARVAVAQSAGFIVLSVGKNGANAGAWGADETENTDGDPIFVVRTPAAADAAGGAYDDVVTVVPIASVYARLVAAGVLP